MATTSFTTLRRFTGYAFTLMLISLCLTGLATGQGMPLVTASSAAGLSHPTGWGTIQESAIDQAGDWFVVDYANGALYEFPAGGGAAIVLGSVSPSASLGWRLPEPRDHHRPRQQPLFRGQLEQLLLMFPWNATTKTWTGLNDGGAKRPIAQQSDDNNVHQLRKQQRARSFRTIQRHRSDRAMALATFSRGPLPSATTAT